MELAASPYYFFDRRTAVERERQLARTPAGVTAKERTLYCARCRHPITNREQEIVMGGSHEHDFQNPHGLWFHIGCFRDAPGCSVFGSATTEYTWFPGYAWQVADCARCDTHLGWRFLAQAHGFFGLVLDRLTEQTD